MDAYRTDNRTINGKEFVIEWHHDSDMGPPWKEHDGHGIVSDWTSRDKQPGEVVIAEDRGSKRFYDFQATMKIALKDGWSTAPYTFKTKGEQAAAAVNADMERMRGWCNDQWHWCGVVVKAVDEDGDELASASLCGIESDAGDYFEEVIADLVAQCEQDMARKEYPVSSRGI